jgi:hypothetical protein
VGGATSFSNVVVRYANYGLWFSYFDNTVDNAQFVDCYSAFYCDTFDINARNVLARDCSGILSGEGTVNFEHLTAWRIGTFALDSGFTVGLTNSLFVAVTNLGGGTLNSNCLSIVASDAGVFDPVGAGKCYLPEGSPYRDAGTTNISGTALGLIRAGTTRAPVVSTNTIAVDTTWEKTAYRDTDVPDLGYHYSPIDYAVSYTMVTNATLRVAPGAVLAKFGFIGLWLNDGATLICDGRADARIKVVDYRHVQETPGGWGGMGWGHVPILGYGLGSNAPNLRLSFVDHQMLWEGGYSVYAGGSGHKFTTIEIKNSSIIGGMWSIDADGTFVNLALTNNIIDTRYDGDMSLFNMASCYAVNNLIHNAPGLLFHDQSGPAWLFANNLFYKSSIEYYDDTLVHKNNALFESAGWYSSYALDATEFVITNCTFEPGPMGRFYLPTNSPLLNAGTTNASLLGLYHYTTTTNQMKETNSMVDIGFHYVAVDSSSKPLDTDSDGLADYVEDQDGNGSRNGSESSWLVADTDADGISDYLEHLLGSNPNASGWFDTNNLVRLKIYSPLK